MKIYRFLVLGKKKLIPIHTVLVICFAAVQAAGFPAAVTDDEGNTFKGNITEINAEETILDNRPEGIPLSLVTEINSLQKNPHQNKEVSPNPPSSTNRTYRPPNGTEEQRLARQLDKNKQRSQEKFVSKQSHPFAASVLELDDSAQLAVTSLAVLEGQDTVRFRLAALENAGGEIEVPLGKILSIRFTVQGKNEVLSPPEEWKKIAPVSQGDQLVVGTPGAFDIYTGILKKFDEKTVSFETDGEVLPIPVKKVYGVVLHHQPETKLVKSGGSVMLWNGTKLPFQRIELKNGGKFHIIPPGLSAQKEIFDDLPPDAVEKIVFHNDNVFFLTSCPVKRLGQPEAGLFDKLLQKNPAQSEPVIIGGVPYPQSLRFYGDSEQEYQLSEPAESLRTICGIEDRFCPLSAGELQIFADSMLLGDWILRGDAEAVKINLKLPDGTKTLRFKVTGVKDMDVPAIVTLGNPKLLKFSEQ